MADTIVDITFTNVQLNDGNSSHTGMFSTSTLAIDYTTMTVSGGPLTFSAIGGSSLPGHRRLYR